MRLSRDQNGATLRPLRVGKPETNFHRERDGQFFQAEAQRRFIKLFRFPRRLNRHAELAARDLFFERFDVRALFKKKIRHARNEARFITPDDGDGGKFFHYEETSLILVRQFLNWNFAFLISVELFL